jgi:endogenous inhibitor of DNA gyrase (YacG/DUF329 family)
MLNILAKESNDQMTCEVCGKATKWQTWDGYPVCKSCAQKVDVEYLEDENGEPLFEESE